MKHTAMPRFTYRGITQPLSAIVIARSHNDEQTQTRNIETLSRNHGAKIRGLMPLFAHA